MTLKVVEYNHEEHAAWLPAFTELQLDCMETDGTIAHFTRPWDKEAITRWWEKRGEETKLSVDGAQDRYAQTGFRFIFFMVATSEEGKEELAGCVMLAYGFSQTGAFRATVEKLFVSPRSRKQGIARTLMQKLEHVALQNKRTLLLLDTETGSAAELAYPRLGYIEMGRIPEYGISPVNGELVEGTFFYKILPGHKGLWGPL